VRGHAYGAPPGKEGDVDDDSVTSASLSGATGGRAARSERARVRQHVNGSSLDALRELNGGEPGRSVDHPRGAMEGLGRQGKDGDKSQGWAVCPRSRRLRGMLDDPEMTTP
jgi:hypothetical protein